MSWFQLDPQSVMDRVQAQGRAPEVPTLGVFLRRGIVGFILVSVAGFAPWALAGCWFHRTIGEAGMYAVCAVTFIGLSGPLLHRLILGPGSLVRFYKLFGIAFAGYSLAWIIGWMTVHGNIGSLVGLLAGTMVMGILFARAFDASRAVGIIVAALFVLNALGYFIGGWLEGPIRSLDSLGTPAFRATLSKLLWGVCYGAGFGAGLGLAFYHCQTSVRDLLAARKN